MTESISSTVVALDDEAKAAAEIRDKIAKGELSACVPCAGMHEDWPGADKAKFSKALSRMFGWHSGRTPPSP